MPDFRQMVREHLPKLNVRPERETEIVRELAQQIEQAYQDAIAGGANESEALRRARLQFPDWTALAQEINSAERPAPPATESRGSASAGLLHDFRYAARLLLRNPGFALGAVLTLALGIGANTAIFSIADTLALRSLPYREPQTLMAVETKQPKQPEIEPWTSALDFFDLRDRNQAFSEIAAISPVWNLVLSGRGDAERLEALFVSADFFPMLGVQPEAGRIFTRAEDNRATPSNLVVLSHAFAARKFGDARAAIGQPLNLGAPYTVLGVLPPDFRYLGEPVSGTLAEVDLWLPLSDNQLTGSARSLRFLKMIGRLKPGVAPEQATADAHRVGEGLASQFPDTNRGFEMSVQPLTANITGRLRPTMYMLLGAVGLILLLACANVANLLLARAASRVKEVSVRVALGASAFRLIRQLLVEGLLLAIAGGLAGLALASAGLQLFKALAPASLAHGRTLAIDGRTLIFTAGVVLACALFAGLPPAWRMLRSPIVEALREAGRGLTPSSQRLRSTLVAGEIALALTLLTGAGLLIHSFVRLLDVDPGFDAHNVVTISTQMPSSANQKPEQRAAIYNSMRDRILALPGVRGVSTVTRLPLMGSNLGSWLWIEGRAATTGDVSQVEYRRAAPGYFTTMGIPLRAGRLLDERDDAPGAPPAVLINDALARKHFPGEDPIGKHIKLGGNGPNSAQPWLTVVGVVGSVRHFALEADPRPEAYQPVGGNPFFSPILVIRTATDPGPLIPALTAAVHQANADCPVYNVFRMDDLVSRSTAQRRFVMTLVVLFAVLAMALAAVGVYGIVAQSVAQRTSEIGLRMALGSTPGDALKLIFSQGLRLTLAGAAAGLVASAALARAMQSLLFAVNPLDPVAFGLAALALIALAASATLIPAWRATRVDPLEALRHD